MRVTSCVRLLGTLPRKENRNHILWLCHVGTAFNPPRPSDISNAIHCYTHSIPKGEKNSNLNLLTCSNWVFLVSYFSPFFTPFSFTVNPKRLLHNFFINISAFGLHCCKISEFRSSTASEKRQENQINTRVFREREPERVKNTLAKQHPHRQPNRHKKYIFNIFAPLERLKPLSDLLSINHREKIVYAAEKKFQPERRRKSFQFSLLSSRSQAPALGKS